MQELAPGIVLFDDIFLDAAKYIEEIELRCLPWQSAQVLVDQNTNESGTNYKARDTDLIMLPRLEELSSKGGTISNFVQEFYKNIEKPLSTYFAMYGAKIERYESPQLLRYGPDQLFHDHIDDHPFFTRRVSLTFYINDNYEGGDIEFRRFGLRVKAKANQLLVFPSNYVYNHQVHPVTDGLRYVVVQWMA